MKLGITGSRTISDFDFIPYFTMRDKEFRAFCRKHGFGRRKITRVISGGAKGIDTIAFRTAESIGIRNTQFLPDKKKFSGKLIKKAFLERNKQIVDTCDILLAVWNGKSRGTKNTLAYAEKTGKPAFVIKGHQDSKKSLCFIAMNLRLSTSQGVALAGKRRALKKLKCD